MNDKSDDDHLKLCKFDVNARYSIIFMMVFTALNVFHFFHSYGAKWGN